MTNKQISDIELATKMMCKALGLPYNEIKKFIPKKKRTDRQIIQIALDYAWHRLGQHDISGIHKVLVLEQVDKLRAKVRGLKNDGEIGDL